MALLLNVYESVLHPFLSQETKTMPAPHHKISEKNRNIAAAANSTKQSRSTFQFQDNRAEASIQGKWQEWANNSHQNSKASQSQALMQAAPAPTTPNPNYVESASANASPIQRITSWTNLPNLVDWGGGKLIDKGAYHISMMEFGGKGTSNTFSNFHVTQEIGVEGESYPHFFFNDKGKYKGGDSRNHPQSKEYIEDEALNAEPNTWETLRESSKVQASAFLADVQARNKLAQERLDWGDDVSFTMTGRFPKANDGPTVIGKAPGFSRATTGVTAAKGRKNGKKHYMWTITATFASADDAFKAWTDLAVSAPWTEANTV